MLNNNNKKETGRPEAVIAPCKPIRPSSTARFVDGIGVCPGCRMRSPRPDDGEDPEKQDILFSGCHSVHADGICELPEHKNKQPATLTFVIQTRALTENNYSIRQPAGCDCRRENCEPEVCQAIEDGFRLRGYSSKHKIIGD